MPVNLLFCEGVSSSPDIRILSTVLQGVGGEVRASGGKYGLGTRILAYRESLQTDKVAGVLDGDFVDNWQKPIAAPRQWVTGEGTVLGWRWQRKEIENYLIDPVVVSQALPDGAPNSDNYRGVLEDAVGQLVHYEAARTALSLSRRRFQELPSCWGPIHAFDRHPFPPNLTDQACRNALRDTVEAHAAEQVVTFDQVNARYEQILPEFAAGGARRRDYLWTFAGKDLLIAMENGLQRLGFQSPRAFREKVILGIERTGGDIIRAWIQEWESLANLVRDF